MEDFTDGHTDSLSNSMESDPLLVGTHTADSSTFAIEKQLGLKPHVAVNLISHRQPCRNSLHSSTRVVFRCSQSVAKVPKLAVFQGKRTI